MRRRDVLMVAHSHFPWDPRIRKQVSALVEEGLTVDVVCLREPGEPAREEWRGARVRRLPIRRDRGRGLGAYAAEYAAFGAAALGQVAAQQVAHGYRLVQVHNLPDPLVFSALVPKLMGVPVLLDMHDFAPELFGSRLGLSAERTPIRVLRSIEAASTAFVDHVLTVNETGRRRLIAGGVSEDRVSVVMNTAPMEGIQRRGPRDGGPVTFLFHGLLSDVYDLETAVDALAALRRRGRDDVRLWFVGGGPMQPALERRARELGVEGDVVFDARVDADDLARILGRADAGYAVPGKGDYKEVGLATKLFECVAVGLPVLSASTRAMRDQFPDVEFGYVRPGQVEELADAFERLADASARAELAERQHAAVWPLRWERMRARYVALIRRLMR